MKAKIINNNSEEPYHHLYEAISLIKDSEEAKSFLDDLCTPAELQAMADRWLVVHPIKSGKSYRTIHDETGVSVTTIGRVARYIAQGAGGYDLIFDRIEKKKNASAKTKNRNTKKREVK